MTISQKAIIQQMRTEGQSYAHIANSLGVSVNTVKSYGKRNEIFQKNNSINTVISNKNNEKHIACLKCRKPLIHATRGKPKKFCSETCRRAWWKFNDNQSNRQAWYTLTCVGCGSEFNSYGNKNRKFCSHSCYIKTRYT